MTVIRIITREDGSLVLRARPGSERETVDPRERSLSDLHDQLKRAALSGELSHESVCEAIYELRDELRRRVRALNAPGARG